MQRVRANCIESLGLSVRKHPLSWDAGSYFPVVHKVIALRTRVMCAAQRRLYRSERQASRDSR